METSVFWIMLLDKIMFSNSRQTLFSLNRIAQSYLFTGPRGVGKTTTARILAMALNSENGPSADFDSSSETVKRDFSGRSLDVLEIDGASNRGIDEISNLREQIKFSPMESRYKIIIIDEVHMLTNQAFNALLRTLEEPPAHAVLFLQPQIYIKYLLQSFRAVSDMILININQRYL